MPKTIEELNEKVAECKTHVSPTQLRHEEHINTADQSKAAMRERAKMRAPHYHYMTAEEQWAEDKRLGILDWDGE
jgi:uncharacterized coiled-coil protein SlyX